MRCSVKCTISDWAEKDLTRCLSAVAELLVSIKRKRLNYSNRRWKTSWSGAGHLGQGDGRPGCRSSWCHGVRGQASRRCPRQSLQTSTQCGSFSDQTSSRLDIFGGCVSTPAATTTAASATKFRFSRSSSSSQPRAAFRYQAAAGSGTDGYCFPPRCQSARTKDSCSTADVIWLRQSNGINQSIIYLNQAEAHKNRLDRQGSMRK